MPILQQGTGGKGKGKGMKVVWEEGVRDLA